MMFGLKAPYFSQNLINSVNGMTSHKVLIHIQGLAVIFFLMLHDSYFNLSTTSADQYCVILGADFWVLQLLFNLLVLALSFNLDQCLRVYSVTATGCWTGNSQPVSNCRPVVRCRLCLTLTALGGFDNVTIAWCQSVSVSRDLHPRGWCPGHVCHPEIPGMCL